MAYPLGDIFIGEYKETQAFGARPDIYSARFNLRGHNGLDFGVPSLTMVLAAADGVVSEIGVDKNGYGNYLKIVHNGYLTLYGHLNDIVVSKGDRVLSGQLIAHSDNSGFSDAPHLHFGVAPCDGNGVKTEPQNGYSGYIDPNSSLCQWNIRNLSAPVVSHNATTEPDVALPSSTFVLLRTKGTNYDVETSYLISVGLNDYLSAHGLPIIDLNNKVQDPKDGEHIVTFLTEQFTKLEQLKSNQTPSPFLTEETVQHTISSLSPEQKSGILSSILSSFHDFIFTQH